MRVSTVALASALSATAFAQAKSEDAASIYAVLATALPASLVSEALTNSAAVASEIESEFNAGKTPTWFSALPTDIQSYLLSPGAAPTGASNASTPGSGTNATNAAAGATASRASNSTETGSPRTTSGEGSSAKSSGTPSGGSAAGTARASGSSTTASSGMAAVPTAMIGGAVAGLVGIMGVLAL